MTVIMRSSVFTILCFMIGMFSTIAFAADEADEGNPLADIPLRPIGPAITSGENRWNRSGTTAT